MGRGLSTRKTGSRNDLVAAGAPRTLQSVDRAIAAVRTLALSEQGMSLTELAQKLGLLPQTLQSILRTLQHHGWVSQDARRGRYRLGQALGQLHRQWYARQDRAALARPMVTDLSREFGEYVILAQWTGAGVMPLVEARSDQELAVRGEACQADRLHVMATGKLLLAMLDEPQRRQIVATLPLPERGPKSVTDHRVLLKQLESIRRRGVAICMEEAAQAVVALAVTVQNNASTPCALGVSLPLARYSSSRKVQLLEALGRAAGDISNAWN